jgi:hypothetical protein
MDDYERPIREVMANFFHEVRLYLTPLHGYPELIKLNKELSKELIVDDLTLGEATQTIQDNARQVTNLIMSLAEYFENQNADNDHP